MRVRVRVRVRVCAGAGLVLAWVVGHDHVEVSIGLQPGHPRLQMSLLASAMLAAVSASPVD